MNHAPSRRGKGLLAALLVVSVFGAAGALAVYHLDGGAWKAGYAQPIAFSHRLHVADKGIGCGYCHPYAGRSQNAGLPPVSKCLGCHDHIIPKHPEIQKLHAARAQGKPLEWVRVFYSPDHVSFPHFRHIQQGVVCQECHGRVEQLDRLPTTTFYMGFCLDCHHARGASRECVACHQ